jgi:hypothetical protein
MKCPFCQREGPLVPDTKGTIIVEMCKDCYALVYQTVWDLGALDHKPNFSEKKAQRFD